MFIVNLVQYIDLERVLTLSYKALRNSPHSADQNLHSLKHIQTLDSVYWTLGIIFSINRHRE